MNLKYPHMGLQRVVKEKSLTLKNVFIFIYTNKFFTFSIIFKSTFKGKIKEKLL